VTALSTTLINIRHNSILLSLQTKAATYQKRKKLPRNKAISSSKILMRSPYPHPNTNKLKKTSETRQLMACHFLGKVVSTLLYRKSNPLATTQFKFKKIKLPAGRIMQGLHR
jgi:hypothetical protein